MPEEGAGIAATPAAGTETAPAAEPAASPTETTPASPQQPQEPQEPSWLGPRLERERRATEERLRQQYGSALTLAQRLEAAGLPADAALKQLEQWEQQRQTQQVAAQTGLPEAAAREIAQVRNSLEALRVKEQESELREALTKQGIDPKEYDNHAAEVRSFRAANPGSTLQQAFWATVGPKQLAKLDAAAQQRVLAQVTGRDAKATEDSSGPKAPVPKPDLRDRSAVPKEDILAVARKLGVHL